MPVAGLEVVGGGRTARIIQRVAEEIGEDIGAAEVFAGTYEFEADDNEIAEKIALATNSRNPVDPRDLKANDQRQRNLAISTK